jgi:hypothetical protein
MPVTRKATNHLLSTESPLTSLPSISTVPSSSGNPNDVGPSFIAPASSLGTIPQQMYCPPVAVTYGKVSRHLRGLLGDSQIPPIDPINMPNPPFSSLGTRQDRQCSFAGFPTGLSSVDSSANTPMSLQGEAYTRSAPARLHNGSPGTGHGLTPSRTVIDPLSHSSSPSEASRRQCQFIALQFVRLPDSRESTCTHTDDEGGGLGDDESDQSECMQGNGVLGTPLGLGRVQDEIEDLKRRFESLSSTLTRQTGDCVSTLSKFEGTLHDIHRSITAMDTPIRNDVLASQVGSSIRSQLHNMTAIDELQLIS